MLSNQILQKAVHDISDITQADCYVWSMEMQCVAAGKEPAKAMTQQLHEYLEEKDIEEQMGDTVSFFPICDEGEPQYIFAICCDKQLAAVAGRLGAKHLESLVTAYKEKIDKKNFYQNLLLDNLLLVDVHNQAKRLRIEAEEERVVFLIQPKKERDNIVIETLKGLYATGTKDYVTSVDEGHIILVKTIKDTENYQHVGQIAKVLVDTLNAEAMVDVRVAYGTIVRELKEVSKSYKEAAMALDVGRIFYSEKNILSYNSLGIGRLIHQLPVSLCEMFLKEVFDDRDVEQFEEETLSTVAKFFENNLNISETARQLYVHRNTLVYRLEKIQKTTGLDVRIFEDALTFKIALMVAEHVKFLQRKS